MSTTLANLLGGRMESARVTAATAFERIRKHARSQQPSMRLIDFVREGWHVVEPETEYVHGWHIDAICEHLEAVMRGDIRNLLITIPPRHAKSLIVSVFLPTYSWTFQPTTRWLYASYAQTLSTRDSIKCRRVIDSAWYQQRWADVFQLTSDQNQKMRFENDRSGYRLATSVDGSATGEGADILICDDPHNVREAHSSVKRETVFDWWSQVMSTRLNDPKTGRRVIVMQRVHQQDLAGHVLEEGGYEHLCLPTEFEPSRKAVTSLGWTDPRREPGQLLWPERFGPAERDAAKLTLGSYGFANQHQQRPAPQEGGMFKRQWFELVDVVPWRKVDRCRFWDCAGTEAKAGSDPDYTVGTLVAKTSDGVYFIEDVIRGRWSAGEVDRRIEQTAITDGTDVRVREEQEPGSAGKSVIASHTRLLAGFDYKGIPATGPKEVRWRPFAVQAEAGNVRVLKAAWNREWLDELANVPYAGHDDQADSAAGAFNELALTQHEITIW